MRWLDSLERRFHFVAIPQFPLFIASANGVIFLMSQVQPAFTQRLTLDPAAIAAGEWWRMLTFLFVPPAINPFFLVFWILLIYQYAQALENTWGEFRFFLFYLIGAIATVTASVGILHQPLDNVSLYTSLFLAFATLFPDFELLLFFFFPVKVKYLAWFMWATMAFYFFMGSFAVKIAIGASLSNYLLFFGADIWKAIQLRWEVYRNRRRFKS